MKSSFLRSFETFFLVISCSKTFCCLFVFKYTFSVLTSLASYRLLKLYHNDAARTLTDVITIQGEAGASGADPGQAGRSDEAGHGRRGRTNRARRQGDGGETRRRGEGQGRVGAQHAEVYHRPSHQTRTFALNRV